MSVTTLANVQDRADRTLTDAEQARVPVLITDVELMIGHRFRNIGGIGVLDEQSVVTVTSWAVLDVLSRKPGSPSSTEVAVDDGRVVQRFEGRGSDAWIRDAWWDLLTPVQASTSQAFTIRPAYTPDV